MECIFYYFEVCTLVSQEEDTSDMLETDGDDEFLFGNKNVRPAHVELKCMIKSALQVFQETVSDRRIGAISEAKVVSIFGTAIHDSAQG